MRKIYHFLGSLPFALLLIGITAFFAIWGTYLESVTDSHRHAAYLTYGHPLFHTLLVLFFVNILFAALRRWPFKKKHIPFLLTHLGLLMVIAGTMVKSWYGIQGSLRLFEGESSQHLLIPDSHGLFIETPSGVTNVVSLESLKKMNAPRLSLVEYSPDSKLRYASWIKGDQVSVLGVKPFLLANVPPYKRGANVQVFAEESQPWQIFGIRTEQIAEAAQQIYKQDLEAVISERDSGKIIYTGPIEPMLEGNAPLTALLHFGFTPEKGFEHPTWLFYGQKHVLGIALDGPEALLNQYVHAAPIPLTVDLVRKPAIAIIEDQQGKIFLFAFDPHGRVHAQTFSPTDLDAIVVYDRGFGGYALPAEIPYGSAPYGRQEVEKELQNPSLKHQNRSFTIETSLIPLWETKTPGSKWEEHRPKAIVQVKHQGKSQYLSLGYDPTARGLKWPVLGGDFVMRLQPATTLIPYAVRLHQARQISYNNSLQPYSYECDVTITDTRTGVKQPTTLSMNQVHETSDGYRFYMANISPIDSGKMKEIQIIVNYDPVRYWLTYAGCAILVMGIVGLFWKTQIR